MESQLSLSRHITWDYWTKHYLS